LRNKHFFRRQLNGRILEARVDGNDVWVQFTTVAGRQYALERNVDFSSHVWLTIAARLPGTGEPITARDTRPGASSSRVVYRVRLEE
jgi:hypothetical protein